MIRNLYYEQTIYEQWVIDMKRNMSKTDGLIRLLVAFAILVIYFLGGISGTLALVLLAIAVIFTITSFISFCPIYAIFGIQTCKVNKD